MTQEEKDLLLKDLCSRLPYNLIVHVHDVIEYNTWLCEEHLVRMKSDKITLKPYLRPMSSMTIEEIKHYHDLCIWDEIRYYDTWESIDYLYSIHVDYRGLIHMELANEATEGMYNIN